MKLLVFSTDRLIAQEGSFARERHSKYGGVFDEVHIIIFSLKKHNLFSKKIADNVFVYPTNSISRLLYGFDAIKIGKKLRVDVVTAQDPFETGLVAYFLGLPFQVQLHTDIFSTHFTYSFLNKIRVLISKFVLKKANCVRVVSKTIQKKLKRDSFVLPIFIRQKKTTKEISYPFQFTILMVSRLTKEKNLSFALRSFKEILSKNSQVGLVLVGDGPEREALVRLSKELGIEKNVVFEGWKEDLENYYSAADLLLHTSLYEGYGMVLIEAALAGLPIVSTPVGIAAELPVVLCNQNDRSSVVDSVHNIISDESFRNNVISDLCKSVDGFVMSEDKYLTEYRNSINVCLKRKS